VWYIGEKPVRSSLLVCLLLSAAGCRAPAPAAGPGAADPLAATAEWFVDQARETGLDFVHFNGMSGEYYDAEVFAPGVALFDYDNDGDLDVYVVQGVMLGAGKTIADATFPPAPPLPPRGRLFRNELAVAPDGTRRLRFTDVTEASGIDARRYGMGAATGDIDNDGWVDLLLTHLGPDQLLRNNGDGTFSDVSARAGVADPGWGVSAAFVDIDRDGWLDLFVGNYLSYDVDADVDCFSWTGEPDYCAPTSYAPQRSRLYRNRGDGTFADVTTTALKGGQYGPTLGVVTADFDDDGWMDIYVANDGQENLLWMNQRDGTFLNAGLASGAALTVDGKAEASMGVDAGDFDNDGDDDLFMTELTGEGQNLYVNQGKALFEDQSVRSRLGPPSLPFTGFGAGWIDVDNDGWLDVLTVNGAVRTVEALMREGAAFPLQQRKQLYRNLGTGSFEEVSAKAGAAFQSAEVSRGAAFGDVDNDGDTDVLVGNNSGPVRLLVNQVGTRRHWIGLRLLGERERRDMLGARVGVTGADGRTVWRRARTDGSYASASDPRVLVGRGDDTAPQRVQVRWPDGTTEGWSDVAVDRWTTLRKGTGRR
jgi:hypothetical protein